MKEEPPLGASGTGPEGIHNVIRLDTDPAPMEGKPAETTRPGRLHGAAIAGMAFCALTGILAMFAFITIGWPGDSGRNVIAVFVAAGVGFVACASAAVFAAARDAYRTNGTHKAARPRNRPD